MQSEGVSSMIAMIFDSEIILRLWPTDLVNGERLERYRVHGLPSFGSAHSIGFVLQAHENSDSARICLGNTCRSMP